MIIDALSKAERIEIMRALLASGITSTKLFESETVFIGGNKDYVGCVCDEIKQKLIMLSENLESFAKQGESNV